MQADIPAISALGCHPLSVPTALTVQDGTPRQFADFLDKESLRLKRLVESGADFTPQ